MPSYRVGAVLEILEARAGLQRVLVDLDAEPERAYVLTQLVGTVAVGDRVVVNTTAVELGLGTGGWHVVHWNLERDELHTPPAGAGTRLGMKLRYTSLQVDLDNSERPDDVDIGGMPVVAAALHSQLAAIAVAYKDAQPDRRLVYVMTDDAALPIVISDLVADLQARRLVDATVTCGHAFGGDFEAVSIPGALAVARHVAHGDAVVVAMGPGSAGTASRLGYSGIGVGAVLDATTALAGIPIAALRVSFADPRPRHRGVSHHSITALSVMTQSRARVPVPLVGGDEEARVRADLAAAGIDGRHDIVDVPVTDAVGSLAAHHLSVASMGRPAAEDPVLFEAAAAAGVLAAQVVP